MTRNEWRRKHEVMQADPRPRGVGAQKRRAACHPERAHYARGQCSVCYTAWYTAQRRIRQLAGGDDGT